MRASTRPCTEGWTAAELDGARRFCVRSRCRVPARDGALYDIADQHGIAGQLFVTRDDRVRFLDIFGRDRYGSFTEQDSWLLALARWRERNPGILP